MWKREELKRKGRALIKKNYRNVLPVCLLLAAAIGFCPAAAFLGQRLSRSFPFLKSMLVPFLVFAVLYQVFACHLIQVGVCRYFMETRKYRRTPVSKVFFLYRLRCILNPSWVMLCRSFFQILWGFTIAGGFVKYYEYYLIPLILAENPAISRRDAFYLSRQLMKNKKYALFKLHLSFLGWSLLSVLTFGLAGVFFTLPYRTATKTELYMSLRRSYVLSRSPGYEHLSDSYLEHVPSEDELLIYKALYEDSRGPYTAVSYFEPEQYPMFLFSVQPPS